MMREASAARDGLAAYIDFKNTRRPRSAHGGLSRPEEALSATVPTFRPVV